MSSCKLKKKTIHSLLYEWNFFARVQKASESKFFTKYFLCTLIQFSNSKEFYWFCFVAKGLSCRDPSYRNENSIKFRIVLWNLKVFTGKFLYRDPAGIKKQIQTRVNVHGAFLCDLSCECACVDSTHFSLFVLLLFLLFHFTQMYFKTLSTLRLFAIPLFQWNWVHTSVVSFFYFLSLLTM